MFIEPLAGELEVFLFQLRQFLGSLDARQAAEVPVTGHWTARNVLLHLNAWETRRAEAVRTWPLRDYDQFPAITDVDAFNAALQEQTARLTWRDALYQARDVHRSLVTELRLRSDDDLQREADTLLSNGNRITLENLIRNGMRHASTHMTEIKTALGAG